MANEKKSDRIFTTRNIVAAFLTFLHNGLYFYWGNLSIYLISYYAKSRDSVDDSDIRPAMTLTFYAIGWIAAMLASGPLATLINVRLLIGFSIILLNSSFIVSYFVIDCSMLVFVVAFGLLVGVGTGLYEGPLLQYYVVNLSQQHSGLLTAIALTGGPAGGLVINQFVTLYLNPNDLSPDSKIGELHIFTQEEILRNVPSLLLILGGSLAILQMIGVCLVQHVIPPDTTNNTNPTALSTQYNLTEHRDEGLEIPETNLPRGERMATNGEEKISITLHNFTPRELIKCNDFYKLILTYNLGLVTRVVLSTYYKIYGQKWIPDDHFLTILGTTQTFCTIPSTVVYGFVIDRIGVKHTLMTMYSGMAMTTLLMYFTAPWNKWAYFIVTACAACVTNVYSCYSIAVLKWFGSKYLTTNIAFVECSLLLGFVITTTVLDPLISIYGHFTEFAWAATSNVLGLVVIVLFLPKQ